MSKPLCASLLACAALAGAAPALAEETSECPTWFPDFSCQRETRFEGFIPPMTMPYYFEEPFVTTGVSAYLLWHEFPNESAFQGGSAWVVAVQARIAITDRLAFIATKDGVASIQPDNQSELEQETGMLDIAAGLKYELIRIPEHDFILTPSFRLELPTGQDRVWSGHGDGTAIPAVSLGWGLGDVHLLGSFGARLPFAAHQQSSSLFYNAQLDYALWRWLTPFFSVNGTHWTRSGNGNLDVDTESFGTVPLSTAQDVLFGAGITDRRRWEGADVLNLGSEGVAGNNLVTVAFGGRVPINRHLSLGAAYEFPVTHREDIFDQRVSLNALLEF
jgi:hypothetical protein